MRKKGFIVDKFEINGFDFAIELRHCITGAMLGALYGTIWGGVVSAMFDELDFSTKLIVTFLVSVLVSYVLASDSNEHPIDVGQIITLSITAAIFVSYLSNVAYGAIVLGTMIAGMMISGLMIKHKRWLDRSTIIDTIKKVYVHIIDKVEQREIC